MLALLQILLLELLLAQLLALQPRMQPLLFVASCCCCRCLCCCCCCCWRHICGCSYMPHAATHCHGCFWFHLCCWLYSTGVRRQAGKGGEGTGETRDLAAASAAGSGSHCLPHSPWGACFWSRSCGRYNAGVTCLRAAVVRRCKRGAGERGYLLATAIGDVICIHLCTRM